MQSKLFRKSSVERFSSPEKLNDYIQVSNPAGWMVLVAALALLLGVLAWGFFGEMTQDVSFTGLAEGSALRCYVSNPVSSQLTEGMEVTIAPMSDLEAETLIPGRIVAIADQPLSYAEADAELEGDYLLAALGISNWNIIIEVTCDEPLYDGMVYTVVAITDTQRPIDLIFQ